MTIAAHIHVNKNGESLLLEILGRLSLQNPGDHFIFFTEKQLLLPPALSKNVTPVLIQPSMRNSLLLHYWYQFKLPALLKRYNANIFLAELPVLSARVPLPQVMLVMDEQLLLKKSTGLHKYSKYVRKYFTKFTSQAAHVFFTRALLQEAHSQKYPALKQKSSVLHTGLNELYFPTTYEAKEELLARVTSGTEYLLCNCTGLSASQMVSVLKAFSLFKKRLKTGLHLIMLLEEGQQLVPDFQNYKYRQTVQFVTPGKTSERAALIAAAFASLYPAGVNGIDNTGLEMLKAGTSLIVADTPGNRKLYGDAVLYAAANEKSLADQMMLLYKDEALKQELIQHGLRLSANHNWESSTHLFWQTILNHSQV